MGLLDSVIGALGQGANSPSAGSSGDLMAVVMGLVQQSGGLEGLLQKLQQGGLGEAVQSWIGTGGNLPVSAEQLGQALGGDTVKQLGQQFGIDSQQLLGPLSQLLPQLVDGLTPQGQLPQGGFGDLGALLQGLGGGGAAGGQGADLGALLGGLLRR